MGEPLGATTGEALLYTCRGDPYREVEAIVLGKEFLREVYSVPSLQRARWRLVRFYEYVAGRVCPSLPASLQPSPLGTGDP